MYKKQPKKRISKRRYPPRICKKTDCKEEFIPLDARQWYCEPQHRIDHNNDLRKIKQGPLVEINQRLLRNQAILKKGYYSLIRHNQVALHIDILRNDGFDFESFNSISVNKDSGMQIYWSLSYGIEGYDEKRNTFIIRKK